MDVSFDSADQGRHSPTSSTLSTPPASPTAGGSSRSKLEPSHPPSSSSSEPSSPAHINTIISGPKSATRRPPRPPPTAEELAAAASKKRRGGGPGSRGGRGSRGAGRGRGAGTNRSVSSRSESVSSKGRGKKRKAADSDDEGGQETGDQSMDMSMESTSVRGEKDDGEEAADEAGSTTSSVRSARTSRSLEPLPMDEEIVQLESDDSGGYKPGRSIKSTRGRGGSNKRGKSRRVSSTSSRKNSIGPSPKTASVSHFPPPPSSTSSSASRQPLRHQSKPLDSESESISTSLRSPPKTSSHLDDLHSTPQYLPNPTNGSIADTSVPGEDDEEPVDQSNSAAQIDGSDAETIVAAVEEVKVDKRTKGSGGTRWPSGKETVLPKEEATEGRSRTASVDSLAAANGSGLSNIFSMIEQGRRSVMSKGSVEPSEVGDGDEQHEGEGSASGSNGRRRSGRMPVKRDFLAEELRSPSAPVVEQLPMGKTGKTAKAKAKKGKRKDVNGTGSPSWPIPPITLSRQTSYSQFPSVNNNIAEYSPAPSLPNPFPTLSNSKKTAKSRSSTPVPQAPAEPSPADLMMIEADRLARLKLRQDRMDQIDAELIVLDCLSGAIADESSSELSILLEELESRFQKRAAIIENRQAASEMELIKVKKGDDRAVWNWWDDARTALKSDHSHTVSRKLHNATREHQRIAISLLPHHHRVGHIPIMLGGGSRFAPNPRFAAVNPLTSPDRDGSAAKRRKLEPSSLPGEAPLPSLHPLQAQEVEDDMDRLGLGRARWDREERHAAAKAAKEERARVEAERERQRSEREWEWEQVQLKEKERERQIREREFDRQRETRCLQAELQRMNASSSSIGGANRYSQPPPPPSRTYAADGDPSQVPPPPVFHTRTPSQQPVDPISHLLPPPPSLPPPPIPSASSSSSHRPTSSLGSNNGGFDPYRSNSSASQFDANSQTLPPPVLPSLSAPGGMYDPRPTLPPPPSFPSANPSSSNSTLSLKQPRQTMSPESNPQRHNLPSNGPAYLHLNGHASSSHSDSFHQMYPPPPQQQHYQQQHQSVPSLPSLSSLPALQSHLQSSSSSLSQANSNQNFHNSMPTLNQNHPHRNSYYAASNPPPPLSLPTPQPSAASSSANGPPSLPLYSSSINIENQQRIRIPTIPSQWQPPASWSNANPNAPTLPLPSSFGNSMHSGFLASLSNPSSIFGGPGGQPGMPPVGGHHPGLAADGAGYTMGGGGSGVTSSTSASAAAAPGDGGRWMGY